QELLGPAGPELPRVGEVIDTTHAEPGPDHVGEAGALGGHDEVTGPQQHEAGGIDVTVGLPDGDLAQIPPAARVLEEVVPLLEHERLGSLPRRTVDRTGGV